MMWIVLQVVIHLWRELVGWYSLGELVRSRCQHDHYALHCWEQRFGGCEAMMVALRHKSLF